MDYWSAMGDVDKYIAACQQYAKTEAAKDEKALMGLGGALAQQFGHEPKAMQAAENFSKMAADKSTDYKTQLNYAGILMRNGKKDKALEAAKKALEMAKPHGDQAVRMVEFQIQQLKSK